MKHDSNLMISDADEINMGCGNMEPQQVQYGDGKTLTSEVTKFSQDNMCSEFYNLLLLSHLVPNIRI
jgi:hypothetical protein